MARRNYDRMYRTNDVEENKTIEIEEEPKKVEEDSLPEVNIEAEKTTNYTGKVIGGLSLNVRKQPSIDGEIIDTIKDGVVVTITEDVNNEWYHITSPDGYVMKRFIEV